MQNKCLHVPTEKQREITTTYTGVSVANIKRIRKISKKIQTAHKIYLGRKGMYHIQVLYVCEYKTLKILITLYYVCTVVKATRIWP
jgi:hypothetical protein